MLYNSLLPKQKTGQNRAKLFEMFIKTHGRELQGQGGSNKHPPTDLRLTHMSILHEKQLRKSKMA